MTILKHIQTGSYHIATAGIATAAVHFGKQALSKISTVASEFAGRTFSVLPSFAPAAAGAGLALAVRGWDYVLAKFDAMNARPKTKEACSFAATVITGAVAGAITGAATGTALVPGIVTLAATAALVWLVVKATDLAAHYAAVLAKMALHKVCRYTKAQFDAKMEKLGLTEAKINELEVELKDKTKIKLVDAIIKGEKKVIIQGQNEEKSEEALKLALPKIKALRSNLESMKKAVVYDPSNYDKQVQNFETVENLIKALEEKFNKIGKEDKEALSLKEANLYVNVANDVNDDILATEINGVQVQNYKLSENGDDVITTTANEDLKNNETVKGARAGTLNALNVLLNGLKGIKVEGKLIEAAVYKEEPKFKETVQPILDKIVKVEGLIATWTKVTA